MRPNIYIYIYIYISAVAAICRWHITIYSISCCIIYDQNDRLVEPDRVRWVPRLWEHSVSSQICLTVGCIARLPQPLQAAAVAIPWGNPWCAYDIILGYVILFPKLSLLNGVLAHYRLVAAHLDFDVLKPRKMLLEPVFYRHRRKNVAVHRERRSPMSRHSCHSNIFSPMSIKPM